LISGGRAVAWLLLLGAVYAGLFGVGSQRWTVAKWGASGLAAAGLVWLVVVRIQRRPDWRQTTAKVLDVTPPPTSESNGRCQMALAVAIWGVTSPVGVTDHHVPWTKWPSVGASLPVMVDRWNHDRVRVLWNKVTPTGDRLLPPYPYPLFDIDEDLSDAEPPWIDAPHEEPEPPPSAGRQ
jgi:hypothetical protein